MRWGRWFGADLKEGGRRWFRENGTRSRPPSQPQWSSSVLAFIPVLATMELADLSHHLGVDLLTDRWVWWLFRWQWWSCSVIFVGFWAEGHVMKKCFWSTRWWWLDYVNHWWWDLGLIMLDFVDLGLLWLVSWFGFNLGWFVNWVYAFDLLRIWCWLC